jgi:hypothetical protein
MALTSQDEPALQVTYQAVVAQLLGTIVAAGGFQIADSTLGVIASLIVGLTFSLVSYVQGRVTRGKVISPATNEQDKATAAAQATAAVLNPDPDAYPVD